MSECVESVEGAQGERVESPPGVKVAEPAETDGRSELRALADEVAKRGSRKLLWDYLRLRSRVMGR